MTLPQHEIDRRKVKWDPTINMGHLITMASSFVSTLVIVMVAYASMDKRVAILENVQISQEKIEREKELQAKERSQVTREKIDEVKDEVRSLRTAVDALRIRMEQQPQGKQR